MKRLFTAVLSLIFLFSFAWSQEADDFDSIFDDAGGDVEVEQTTPVIPAASSSSSGISFTGHFAGDVGLSAIIIEKPDFGGYLSLDNTLYMTVRPAPVVNIYGALNTSLSNKFSLDLSYLYFDYMLFDRVFISAGKKNLSWGYTRLFKNGNIMEDTNGQLNAEFRFPWSTGTFTFVGAYDYKLLSDNPSYKDISYAFSLEQTVLHTSVNLFAKINGLSLAGLEIKRTLFGFDCYGQAYVNIADYKKLNQKAGYGQVIATAGFYKLWDGFDPNIGINIEYEYKYIQNPADGQNTHNNLLWLQWGIKRIGKKKNMKGAVDWQHNFTDSNGKVTAAFIVDGLFPYASWKNVVEVSYSPAHKIPEFKIATTISLSLDY